MVRLNITEDGKIIERRTNADVIRSMSDEEMAIFLWDIIHFQHLSFGYAKDIELNDGIIYNLEFLKKEIEVDE